MQKIRITDCVLTELLSYFYIIQNIMDYGIPYDMIKYITSLNVLNENPCTIVQNFSFTCRVLF